MYRIWVNRSYATAARSLQMLRDNPDGVPVTVIGTHVDPHSPVLLASDLAFAEPALTGPDYADWALHFALEHGVDVFIPRHEQGAVAAAARRFADAGISLVCPPARTVELFADKASTHRAVREAGLAVAPWQVAGSADTLLTALVRLRGQLGAGVPLCVKPTRGVGGLGFRMIVDERPSLEDLLGEPMPVASLEDLLAALRAAEAAGTTIPQLLVQPVLDGPEISVDLLAAPGGRLLAAVPRVKSRRERTLPDDAAAIEYAAQLVRTFELSYLTNVQLRWWEGRRVLLEVNTRASGGLFQTALAGVNLPWAAVRLAVHGDDGPLPVTLGARYAVLDDVLPLAPAS